MPIPTEAIHIKATSDRVTLDENAGEVEYRVELRDHDRAVRVRPRIHVVDEAHAHLAAHIEIDDDEDRVLEPGVETRFKVRIQVPPDAGRGRAAFLLRLLDADDPRPEGRHVDGQTVSFDYGGRRPLPKWLWIAAAALLLLLVGGGGLVIAGFGGDDERAVPDVVGQDLEEAREALAELGFVVEAVGQVTGAPELQVLAVEPAAGTELAEGATVTLTHEAVLVAMPALVGLRTAEASAALEAAGLALQAVEVSRGRPNDADTVLEQTPAAGERVPQAIGVELVVEAPLRTVPDLVGRPASEAVAALAELGLPAEIETVQRDPGRAGRVLEQQPSAEQLVQEGARIRLTAEVGRIAAPRVLGLAVAEARAELERAGLVAKVLPAVAAQHGQEGTILDQSPPADTPLVEGDEVQLLPKGPTRQVPQVAGKTAAEASQILASAGFETQQGSYYTTDPNQKGRVQRTEPPVGSFALANSRVRLDVGTDRLVILPGAFDLREVRAETHVLDARRFRDAVRDGR